MNIESAARKVGEQQALEGGSGYSYAGTRGFEDGFVEGALWAVERLSEADVLAEASRHFHVTSKRDQLEEWWLCDCGERFDILVEHQVEKIVALYKGEGGQG